MVSIAAVRLQLPDSMQSMGDEVIQKLAQRTCSGASQLFFVRSGLSEQNLLKGTSERIYRSERSAIGSPWNVIWRGRRSRWQKPPFVAAFALCPELLDQYWDNRKLSYNWSLGRQKIVVIKGFIV
jgi:hypothetical protein